MKFKNFGYHVKFLEEKRENCHIFVRPKKPECLQSSDPILFSRESTKNYIDLYSYVLWKVKKLMIK